jgi:hypothetical protein
MILNDARGVSRTREKMCNEKMNPRCSEHVDLKAIRLSYSWHIDC